MIIRIKDRRMSWKNKNRMKYIARAILILLIVFVSGVCLMGKLSHASWMEEEDGIKYLQDDGQYAVGFLDVEDARYYFDTDGHLVTGKFYVEEEDAYYYSDETGVVQYGVIQADEDFYITDEDGRLMTGFVLQDGKRYFFNEIAQLVVGWFKQDGNWYYADSTGVIMTGFVTVDGYRYYLREDGTRVSDAVLLIDDVTYIFNGDGSVDENATILYPVFQQLNAIRVQNGCQELVLNSKVQACAILRASELVNGFSVSNEDSLEQLLANRGVLCSGGYEFSYGGMENYDIERLLSDMQKDVNLVHVLTETALSEVGLGIHTQDGVSYYDIIFTMQNK